MHTVQRILWSIYSLGAGFKPYCRRFEFKFKCNFRLSRHAAFTVNAFSANMGTLLFNFNWAITRIFHPTSALRIESCPRFPTHNLKNKTLFDQQHCIETANTVWHIPSLSYWLTKRQRRPRCHRNCAALDALSQISITFSPQRPLEYWTPGNEWWKHLNCFLAKLDKPMLSRDCLNVILGQFKTICNVIGTMEQNPD